MGNISIDPDGYGPSDIIQRLQQCLSVGIYGIDYTIIARDKNEALLENYILSERDRIDILKKLTVNDYIRWEYGNNADYPNDIIHFFRYKTNLIPRGKEDAPNRPVELYIKMTWTKPNSVLIVISFHD